MSRTRAGSGQIKPNLKFQGSIGIVMPVGSTAERNPTPEVGEIRYNTDSNAFEGYNGIAWGSMGPYPFFSVEYFVGDGETSQFTLGFNAESADLVIVTLNGVALTAEEDFELVSPNVIRFFDSEDNSDNPPLDEANITVRYFSPITAASVPAGTITAQELAVTGTAGQYLRLDNSGNLEFATITLSNTDPAVGGDLSGTVSNAQINANTIGIAELKVSDGQIGQVLATDGAGNLSFINVPSSFNTVNVNSVLRLTPLNAAPTAQAGAFAVADGITWNPADKIGNKPYPVFYDGTIWQALY